MGGYKCLKAFDKHGDVMMGKRFPHYWCFVRVDSPHKAPVMGDFDIFFDVNA